MSFDPASRNALTPHDLGRFAGDSLFARVARVLCEVECLPRKELFESWEVARRTRRRVHGRRVVDLACGHGLIAHLMLLLDRDAPEALAVDVRLPPSAATIHDALVRAWPALARVRYETRSIEEVAITDADVLVSAHACGALTDTIIDKAIASRVPVAVLPCCHDDETCDSGGLRGWLDLGLAIDVTRAAKLRRAGYDVRTQRIPAQITEKNRLLIGLPP